MQSRMRDRNSCHRRASAGTDDTSSVDAAQFNKQTFSKHLNKTHTRPFNGSLSGTTQVSRYQKGKTNLDFTEARGSGIS